jgi:hypothetical protein
MSIEKSTFKAVFTIIIFMFSLALAYFTANYARSADIFDYWMTLFIAAVAYIVIGLVIYQIFAVSLGFLFSADVLILHLLFENFGDIDDPLKVMAVGIILIILYAIADLSNREQNNSLTNSAPPPIPPANS